MKNFYHYVMAMLYLKIAHRQPANSDKWFTWIERSGQHINVILKSLDEDD